MVVHASIQFQPCFLHSTNNFHKDTSMPLRYPCVVHCVRGVQVLRDGGGNSLVQGALIVTPTLMGRYTVPSIPEAPAPRNTRY